MRSTERRPEAQRTSPDARRGFTLVELLVVIGIIALLIGLLLPALGKVVQRAKGTQTLGTMQNFAKACDAYFQQFGEYPGAVPDEYLLAGLTANNGDNATRITSAENALLALMGGYRVSADPDYQTFGQGTAPEFVKELVFTNSTGGTFRIKIDQSRIGEGPVREGKKYDPFYSPKGREFGRAAGQIYGPDFDSSTDLPDLVDAWGAPIIFIKQQRGIGPLVNRSTAGGLRGRFERFGLNAYARSTGLGDQMVDQTDPLKESVLNTDGPAAGVSGVGARDLTLGQLIRHAGMSAQAATGGGTLADSEKVYAGTPRGKYFLFSAGPDGIYFSKAQLGMTNPSGEPDIVGSGTSANPDGPRVIEKFDDVVVSGGS